MTERERVRDGVPGVESRLSEISKRGGAGRIEGRRENTRGGIRGTALFALDSSRCAEWCRVKRGGEGLRRILTEPL